MCDAPCSRVWHRWGRGCGPATVSVRPAGCQGHLREERGAAGAAAPMAGEGRGEERQEDTEQKRRCPASLSRWLCSVPAGSRRIRDSFRIPVRVPADSRAPAQFLPEALGGPRPRAQEKALGGAPGCAACGGGGAGERGALVGPPGVALSPSDTGSSFGESLGSAGAAPRGQTSPGGTGVQQVGGARGCLYSPPACAPAAGQPRSAPADAVLGTRTHTRPPPRAGGSGDPHPATDGSGCTELL